MFCCSNCFNDKFLEGVILERSERIDICEICSTDNTEVIKAELLSDYFHPLLDLYREVDSGGKSIISLLKEDWCLFASIEEDRAIKLLNSIFQTKFNKQFVAKNNNDKTKILNWQDFKLELKHTNRYFPKKAPSYEHLKELLSYILLPKEDTPFFLYRARVNIDTPIIKIEEMGKPPAKLSTAGRANPIGIPYLYTASDIQTAIAEIRPYKGDNITIVKFKTKEYLALADLRNPRLSISPFELDEDGLNQIFIDLEYLCHLGEELSKPILPREAHLEYLSSQYLCELIKDCGFDGVVYKSSVGDGDNYAIFSDNKLEAIKTEVHFISNIEIKSDSLSRIY